MGEDRPGGHDLNRRQLEKVDKKGISEIDSRKYTKIWRK
jgi:hypothetical protein